ncbi:MAG TPA: diacylglycerol kinase family protein [Candidatus Sulfopaludibacter sp.]|nr:diacylglycerol kinase family protein [Candidatus Sulfopaludibacter sp.]
MTAAIVNPRAGAGAAGRRWPSVNRMLTERIGSVKVCFTRGPGHATVLARDLADAGCDLLIAAGGDGTLNEVVNGILMGPSDVRLGLLPLASGGDFARTLGVSGLDTAVNALAAGHSRSIDAFRARFRGAGGAPTERCFLNAASFGVGAVAAGSVRGLWGAVPGRLRYFAAIVPGLAAGRSFRVTLRLDDSAPASFDITTAAVANGQYQGGGIRIAPEAILDDGLADVTVVERVSLAEVAAHLTILYNGALYSHPKVGHWRAARMRADADGKVPVELDGEPVGTLPLEIEVLRQSVRMVVPPVG